MGTPARPKNVKISKIPGRLIGGAGRRRGGWPIFGQVRRGAVMRAAGDQCPAKPDGGGLPGER